MAYGNSPLKRTAMQFLDMPDPDIDRVLERAGVAVRFRVYHPPRDRPLASVLLLAPWAIVPSDIWAPQVAALSASYRVVVVDGRGSGGSGRPRSAAAYRTEEYVADAIAVLDQLEIDGAHLAGLSFGGHVAALLAAEHPERALSATVIAPSAPFGPAHPYMTPENFLAPRRGASGWALFNRAVFLEDYLAFARFFIEEAIGEPDCADLIAQGVAFALQTDGATLALTMRRGRAAPRPKARKSMRGFAVPHR
jgi:pimeloyl-ACP methyl ester carboxylesterase